MLPLGLGSFPVGSKAGLSTSSAACSGSAHTGASQAPGDSVVDGDSSSSGSSDVVLVRARLAAAELAHQIAAEEVAWFGSSVLSSLDRETTSHGQSASEPAEAGSGTPAVRVSPSRSIGKRHAMMAAALQERKRGNKSGCARTLQRIKTLEAALNNRRSALATAQEVCKKLTS